MKKFIIGFLIGAMIFGTVGYAVTYVAHPATFKVMVNGKEFVSDPPALVVEGRTYLPLRAIGDALGVPVEWNAELNRAEVGSSTPVADTNTYSRQNPAPLNTVQTYTSTSEWLDNDHTITMRVVETVRGDAAWKMIKETNMFNEEAEEGYEYALAKIAVTAQYIENDGAYELNRYKFTAFSSNNEEMTSCSVVEPAPAFEGKIYAGGNAEGWVTFLVRKDDANPKIAYGLDYNGQGGVWFSLN